LLSIADVVEIREKNRQLLGSLLKIKKKNPDIVIEGLDELIADAVLIMDTEDVALVEKVIGVKVL